MGHCHVRDLSLLDSRTEHQRCHSRQRRSQLAVQAADSRPRVSARIFAFGGKEESSGGSGYEFQIINFARYIRILFFLLLSINKRKREAGGGERERKIQSLKYNHQINIYIYICIDFGSEERETECEERAGQLEEEMTTRLGTQTTRKRNAGRWCVD